MEIAATFRRFHCRRSWSDDVAATSYQFDPSDFHPALKTRLLILHPRLFATSTATTATCPTVTPKHG
jgi:hypothetical protein